MSKSIAAIVCSIALAIASGATNAGPEKEPDLGQPVSIIQLIANPEKYDGKVVIIYAWATIKFEGNTLCMVSNPASSSDCLRLHFDDGPYNTEADAMRYKAAKQRWQKYSGKVVFVRGTFEMRDDGPCCSGAISHITEVHNRKWPWLHATQK